MKYMYNSKLIAWLGVIIWALVIFTFSAQPNYSTGGIIWWDFVIKKTAHIVEYSIFFALFFRAVNITVNKKVFDIKIAVIVAFIVILYAGSDEYHQRFVYGRTSKLRDVGFDTFGTLLTLFTIKFQKNKFLSKIIFNN